MRKIICLLSMLMLCLTFFMNQPPEAIGLHETNDGTTYGEITNPVNITFHYNTHSLSTWTDPNNLDDGNNDSWGQSSANHDIHLYETTNATIESGTILQVHVRWYRIGSQPGDNYRKCTFTPDYTGTPSGLGNTIYDQSFGDGPSPTWSDYYDITNHSNAPDPWTFSDVQNLHGWLISFNTFEDFTLYVSIVEIRVTYSLRFNVTRDVGSILEKNNFSFISPKNYLGNVTLKIPVSTDVMGIVNVTNNTDNVQATGVNSSSELVNNTYWYDSTNQYVYIGTENLSIFSEINWTINCSYGAVFNINIPQYIRIGDYLMMDGMIENSSGEPINNMIARTYIYYINGSIAIGDDPPIKWNCTGGNYRATISTNTLVPGTYYVAIKFTDSESGITFWEGQTFYLSYSTPSGVYSDAFVIINWYNTNEGLGLPEETLKIYIDDVRQVSKTFYGYTGQTFNLTIKDYYNFSLYTNDFTITSSYYFIDLGLTFHEYDFTNTNDEYYIASFLKNGATRWYEKIVAPMGQKSFMLPSGNYTIRVYNADNSSYVSWTQTIDRSRGYLISGYNITNIIEGQSVIEGQILQLITEIGCALMPDSIMISRNPPIIFSAFDRIGMMLGQNYYTICPPVNVIAQTRYETTGNWINNTCLIPSNGTIKNGSITIAEDIIYFSVVNGTVPTWVNISYTSNETVIQNTSYLPNKFYPEGFNVTINASSDIHINRETRFNQQKKFYWEVYPSTNNPGWITETNGKKRTGYHRAGFEIDNTMNTIWYDVYVYAGFSPDSNPDLSTVRVKDVDNDNILLKEGENFKSSSGIEFKLTGAINISENRNFLCEYYSSYPDQYYYGNDVIHIDAFQENKRHDNKLYNYFEYTWMNTHDKTYRGSLSFYFDFEVPTSIKQNDIIVYDADQQQNITNFIISDQFLQIGSNAVGDVSSGGGKTYKVYFKFDTYPGQNVEDLHLATPLTFFLGIPISIFLVFVFIGLFLMLFGIFLIVFREKKSYKDYGKGLIGVGLLIAVVVWVLSALGV